MSYFVTGATGFIGRNLVELLLEREGTIYVLVREGSKGRLEELRNRWGVDDDRVVGDRRRPLRAAARRLRRGPRAARGRGRPPLPPGGDLRHDRRTPSRSGSPTSRAPATWSSFAEAVEAGRVHMVSSIAAAGLYKGTWREDMFEEAQDVDNHPYFQTKHESEGVVRNECTRPWRVYRPGIVVGHSETGEMDKVDGPYYFFKLIRRIRNAVPQWLPMPGVEGREINIVPVDFVVRAMDHIAHDEGLDGTRLPPHRPEPAHRRRGDRHLRPRRPRAAVLGAAAGRRDRGARSRWSTLGMTATPLADAVARPGARRLRHPALGAHLRQLPDPLRLAPDRRRRSRAPGSRCRRWRPTRASSGTTGSATSTPTCSATGR